MKSACTSTRGQSPHAEIRREQLRRAKRAQRERERVAGMQTVPLKLAAKDAARMRAVIAQADFPQRLRAFLDGELIEIAAYENLAALCWNRRSPFIVAEEAFRLYERNWRYVNVAGMKSAERALIERLKMRYGNGVLNV